MISNEELVVKIQTGEDRQTCLEQLYLQNRGLIGKIAARYVWAGDIEDLIQEGFIGLMTAAERWKPDAGVVFSTYAVVWIRQSIQKYCEDTGHVVRLSSQRAQRLRRYLVFLREYEAAHGKAPAASVICEALNLSPEQLCALELDAASQNTASLSAPAFGEDDDLTLGDVLPADAPGTDDVLEKRYQEELSAFLWGLVDDLPKDQARVLRWRYRDGLTLAQCDGLMDAKCGRASRLEAVGIRSLQRTKPTRQIRAFTGERLYSEGLRGSGLGSYQRTFTSATERAALKDLEQAARNEME